MADKRAEFRQSSLMGISFDRDARIAGYRVSIFRDALRGYLRTRSPGSLVDLKSIFDRRRDGAIVYEELLDRGLIDRDSGKVTEAGEVLLRSKVVARTPLKKAKAVLDALLERIDKLNRDPETISRVDEVWLYGSMLREEAAVGDIDLAITRSTSPRFPNLDARVEQAKRLLVDIPEPPQSWTWEWDRIDWLFRRSIYGTRRHALLAGAKEGVEDLMAVATPCQLIYDRARGGRVADAIVPRHPQSKGRADTVDRLPVLPNLTPARLQPMDARWVAGYDRRGEVRPYDMFRGWTEDCMRLFPDHPRHLRVAAFGDDLGRFPWTPAVLKRPDLDGCGAVAVVHATDFSGMCVTLHRLIEEEDSGALLTASLGDLLLHRNCKRADPAGVPEMVAVISLILAVDAERALRRAAERSGPAKVTIRVLADDLPDEIQVHLRDKVVDTLAQRVVAIEPTELAAFVTVKAA